MPVWRGLGEHLENLMRIIERRRHQVGRLAHCVAEHDALVAGAFVLVAGGVHALRNVDRLLVQQHLDIGGVPMEAALLVADVPDRAARDLDDPLEGNVRAAHLAGDHHAVGGGEGLGRDADLA